MDNLFYTVEERVYVKTIRYEVVSYNTTRMIRTIYAICPTREQAETELAQVKAGTHSTQTQPGGTL